MVFEKDSIERSDVGMYKDMMVDALKNRGVIFILIVFLALCALSFGVGYYKGVHSVICPVCKIF